MLGSKGQKETVTLATCFREAALMSAILTTSFPRNKERNLGMRFSYEHVMEMIDDIIKQPVYSGF